MSTFHVNQVRKDFPILDTKIHGKPLIYFDNGATSQKPTQVISRINRYYENENANVHRGVHYLSDQATQAYEEARTNIASFIGASSPKEIVFTKGTTDGINTIAYSLGELLQVGDEILISGMEHHANIVPWQLLCERKGTILKVIPVLEDGTLDLEAFSRLLSNKTKLLSVVHVSNTLGTINPLDFLIKQAKSVGALVMVDAAQSIQHLPIDVQTLGCDFLVFSGHKVFGPTGIGVLYGKLDLLNSLPPYQGGGDMIDQVTFEKTTYQEAPLKFEAGTPNIAGAIALSEAFHYLNSLDLQSAFAHELTLGQYLRANMKDLPSMRFIGEAPDTCATLSFLVGKIHPLDLGTLLDKQGIAVRTGHHCTQPLMHRFNIPGTVRASLAFYNTQEEIDQFIIALERSIHLLS
ncbi:MAG: aminotransferase class V-fold PLP-dependent enzyme [Flavobacteriales bacterium]|jgi:cysteine desulfurase/selenocysteine lyase